MLIFKSKPFDKWQKSVKVTDHTLLKAIEEIENGLVDADLGGNIVKKRVPIGARGKSKGVRTLIAFKIEDRAFFLYGFAKKEMGNVTPVELKALKKLAKYYLDMRPSDLRKAMKDGSLIEIKRVH